MAKAATPKMTTAKSKTSSQPQPAVGGATPENSSTLSAGNSATGTSEAKTRFSAALDEAKAGAAALKAEAATRAGTYRQQAKGKSSDLMSDAKGYGEDAKVKAADLAREGKAKASEAISSLSKMVSDNAGTIDEKLGPKYGDYARTASRNMQEAADTLNAKSVEELSEDARAAVRKSPGAAVGIAAVTGFMIARLFRGKRG